MDKTSLPPGNKRIYYGWVIVAVMALAGFTQSAETFPVLGVFLKPMTEEFGWSRSSFAGAMTIGTVLGGIVAIGAGPLIDRFGSRWTLVISFTVLGGTLVAMAGISRLWQFYALQIVGRMLNMGVIALATIVVIPKWFVVKRGRAVAVGQLGGKFGNAITPLYVQALVNAGSWRLASLVAGIVIWAFSLLPSAIFLRRRPEDLGLLPDGAVPDEWIEGNEPKGSEVERRPNQEISLTLKEVSKLPSFYLLILAFSVASFAGPALFLHMIPFFTDQGLSANLAVAVVAVWSGSGAIGSLGSGFLAERYSMRITLTIGFLLTALGYGLLLIVKTSSAAIAWGFYLGSIGGGMFTLQQVVFADYYGRDSLGAIRGVIWPVQMATNALGPLAAAVAYDLTGGYTLVFSICSLLMGIASLSVFFARPPNLSQIRPAEIAR